MKQKLRNFIQQIKIFDQYPSSSLENNDNNDNNNNNKSNNTSFRYVSKLKASQICCSPNCSSFEKVCEDIHQCEECEKSCCKKCIKGENGCPSIDCENGIVDQNQIYFRAIQKLKVKCSICEDEMEKSQIEEHISNHKFFCVGKQEGCEVSGNLGIISIHQPNCEFVKIHERKQIFIFLNQQIEIFQKIVATTLTIFFLFFLRKKTFNKIVNFYFVEYFSFWIFVMII